MIKPNNCFAEFQLSIVKGSKHEYLSYDWPDPYVHLLYYDKTFNDIRQYKYLNINALAYQ